MISRPRLYARTQAPKTNSSLSSLPNSDVLVLLDAKADFDVIVNHLNKLPILCPVVVLPDVNALDQYYQSLGNSNNSDNYVHLIASASFIRQINKSFLPYLHFSIL